MSSLDNIQSNIPQSANFNSENSASNFLPYTSSPLEHSTFTDNNSKQTLHKNSPFIHSSKSSFETKENINFKTSKVYPEEIEEPENKNIFTICDTCNNWIEDSIFETHKRWHSSFIVDKLYLGSSTTSANIRELRKLEITSILNCADEIPNTFVQDSDFTYKNLTLKDGLSEPIKHLFNECVEFISQSINKGKGVLVHCAMGKSRSATIVIIYLMIAQKMTLRQAYDFVKEKRPVIVPNPSYVKHLLEVELEMYGQNSIKPEEIRPSYKHIRNW